MYLVTNLNDAVIYWGDVMSTNKYGNPKIEKTNGDAVCFLDTVNIYEVSELPQEVEAEKYCYTEADGFYPNPNWHEPTAYDLAPQEIVDAIIDEYTNELIEMGVL